MRNNLRITLALNIFLALVNLLRAVFYQQFLLIRGIKDESTPFFRKRDLIWLVIESILISLSPFTFFIGRKIIVSNAIIASDIYYFWNDFLHINQLYKVIIILRSFLRSSEFSSNRAYRVW